MKNIFKQHFPIIKWQGLIFIFLPFLLAISSCTKTYNCGKTNLILSLNNKTADSLSDFTIYKFQKGTNFGALLDSVRVINGAGVYFETVNNKTNVFTQWADYRMIGEFDWKVHFYSTTVNNGLKEISISSIEEQNETMKCKKTDFATSPDGCECMNTLKSYKLNGVSGVVGNKISYNDYVGYEVTLNP
ncbi:MAG: hypothetical protein ACOYLP_01675 [Flavobacterium sp.]|uniref:hypothetical protein n=1 Tax=Flavobacterium sp. TaxID=239 RepID=UPI003BBBDD48